MIHEQVDDEHFTPITAQIRVKSLFKADASSSKKRPTDP
jgi:hypothetical protein